MAVDLERVWEGVTARIWSRPQGPVERLARAVLRSPALARALVTTPALLGSWLLATAVVLGVGVLVSRELGTPVVPLLAPALTGAGIAYSYGPGTDPAYELARTLPVGPRMLLMVRALAVFAVNAVLGLAATFAAPAADGITVNWLLPMTAVAALCLAAATLTGSPAAGVTIGLAGWAIAVLAAHGVTGRTDRAATSPVMALPDLLFTAVCVGVTLYATRVPRSVAKGVV